MPVEGLQYFDMTGFQLLSNIDVANGSIGIWRSKPAITAFRRSIDFRIATLPAGDLGIARAKNNLARLLITSNRLQQAKPLVDAALQTRTEQLPAERRARGIAAVGDGMGAQQRRSSHRDALLERGAVSACQGASLHAT